MISKNKVCKIDFIFNFNGSLINKMKYENIREYY